MRLLLLFITASLVLAVAACGNNATTLPETSRLSPPTDTMLGSLPADGVQPWEHLDSRGFVVAKQNAHGASAFAADSLFSPGVERFTEVGDVTDSGEASVVVAGSNSLSGGIYRFTLGGVQPSALAVDANLRMVNGKQSQYWVGVSDYSAGTWQWHGPYSEAQVTLTLDHGGNYLSPLGNTFVAITAFDDSQFDIVGVTVSPRDAADTTAPPTPAAPTATAVAGGIELSWTDVIAADLAGYQIYWSYSPFSAPTDNGVKPLPWLENTTRMVLPVKLKRDVYVSLAAVDTNGNASANSAALCIAMVTIDNAVKVAAETQTDSVMRGDPATITATGADLYDFDTNGDGVFDITGDVTGSASIDTSATGIIRPRVRGTSTDGKAVAFGSVSLIVSGNQRPVASGVANPAYGYTPLAVTYVGEGTDFDGTIAEFAWDRTGDGIYEKTSAVSGTFSGNLFTPGLYNAKFRVTDDKGAWDVDTVSIQVLPIPLATLQAAPNSANPGERIDFSASVSGGTAVQYEWDFDNDGTYELDSGASAATWNAYTAPGRHQPGVRVTFDDSSQALASGVVLVHGAAIASPSPDSSGEVLGYSSLALVNGNPALSYQYFDGVNHGLRYVRASNAEGSAWDPPQNIDSTAYVGQYTSLVVVNGNPAISYFDATNQDLKYVRAGNPDGSAWGSPQTLDSSGNTGWTTSLAVVNGKPAISYWDSTNGYLKYVRAGNADGSGAWGTPQTPDSSGLVNGDTSLAVVNGNPAISYLDGGNGDLKYVRAGDADGSGAWGTPQTLDSGGFVGQYTSLAVVSGFPAVSYLDNSNDDLKYVRADNADGSAWGMPQIVDGAGNVGRYTSLALVNGFPAISYFDLNNSDLKYVRAGNPSGSVWDAPQTLDSGGSVGQYTSLIALDGYPAISYMDSTNSAMKFLTLY